MKPSNMMNNSHSVKLDGVKAIQESVEQINIYANEGDIYTVGLQVGPQELTVFANDDKPLLFRSLINAKRAFKACVSAKTEIICSTPYDEMIGHQRKD